MPLRIEQVASEYGTEYVREGAAEEDTHQAIPAHRLKNRGNDEDHWGENQHLTRETGDDGNPRLIDALEELRVGDSEADEWRHDKDKAQGGHTDGLQFGIAGEGHREITGHEEDEQRAYDTDGDITLHGKGINLTQAIEAAGTVIVTGNRLHTLADADDEHDDKRAERVGYTVGGHGIVTAIIQQLVIEQGGDGRACYVHREGADADSEDVAENSELGCPTMTTEADE